jgi:F-type H+-transporting ATPase subunit gamma
MEVYHSLLEAIASEQSARMVAMRNATDNAEELGSELTLAMNKIRQDSITNELLDLIGGQVALEG